MNKLTIKRNSWHYNLASKFAWSEMVKNPKRWEYGEPSFIPNDDFCSYLRHVLLGVAVIALAVAAFVFYTYCNVLLFVDVFRDKFVFANGTLRQCLAFTIDGLLLLALVCRLLWKIWFDWGFGGWCADRVEAWWDRYWVKWAEKQALKGTPQRDPFYRAAYDTLKHKFCMKIEVTND